MPMNATEKASFIIIIIAAIHILFIQVVLYELNY